MAQDGARVADVPHDQLIAEQQHADRRGAALLLGLLGLGLGLGLATLTLTIALTLALTLPLTLAVAGGQADGEARATQRPEGVEPSP